MTQTRKQFDDWQLCYFSVTSGHLAFNKRNFWQQSHFLQTVLQKSALRSDRQSNRLLSSNAIEMKRITVEANRRVTDFSLFPLKTFSMTEVCLCLLLSGLSSRKSSGRSERRIRGKQWQEKDCWKSVWRERETRVGGSPPLHHTLLDHPNCSLSLRFEETKKIASGFSLFILPSNKSAIEGRESNFAFLFLLLHPSSPSWPVVSLCSFFVSPLALSWWWREWLKQASRDTKTGGKEKACHFLPVNKSAKSFLFSSVVVSFSLSLVFPWMMTIPLLLDSHLSHLRIRLCIKREREREKQHQAT